MQGAAGTKRKRNEHLRPCAAMTEKLCRDGVQVSIPVDDANEMWLDGVKVSICANEAKNGWREVETDMLDNLDKMTIDPRLEQEKHLKYILEKNRDTEYLRKHGMNGGTDVDSFKHCLPVADYEAYREYIDRIANGDTSPILSADPAVEVLVSSGTTGGDPKIYPVTAEDMELRGIAWNFVSPVLSRALPSLTKGKFMNLAFVRASSWTPCGLQARTAVSSFIHSRSYRERPYHPIYKLTSPAEVFECLDTEAAMYGHLLCGLLQRDEVVRIGAVYATIVVKAMRSLENWLSDICEDIETGVVSCVRVPEEAVRAAILPLLQAKGAQCRRELADSIRKECTFKDEPFQHDGIIRRLWPHIEVIDTGGTGPSKAYLPALANYSDNLRIICTPMYAATEGFFGLNMSPACGPEKTYYTFVPNVAYYEFIRVEAASQSELNKKVHSNSFEELDASDEKVFDLASLKIGQQYTLLVSTVSGYYRIRIDDVLQVVGFYNNSPMFEYVRRMNTLLSVDHDKTDEVELHTAVSRAAQFLERKLPGWRLVDYTSHTEHDEPGHYVIIWELSCASSPIDVDVSASVMDQCCTIMEASLNSVYREGRYEDIIGPLELRLVERGTFDVLFESAVNRGASMNQYKMPRGLGPKHGPLLQIVKGRMRQRHVCRTKPPFTPSTYKTNGASADVGGRNGAQNGASVDGGGHNAAQNGASADVGGRNAAQNGASADGGGRNAARNGASGDGRGHLGRKKA